MDWPGAQEIAKRLQKTIEPRLLEDEEDPAIQAAKMENEQLRSQMDEMRVMLDNVQRSIEAREVDIKAYDAETKRISAVQAGMTPEQIQDIVLGTISGMMTSGDLVAPMQREAMMPPEMGMELPPQ
jgi:aminopeptidase N